MEKVKTVKKEEKRYKLREVNGNLEVVGGECTLSFELNEVLRLGNLVGNSKGYV